MARLVRNAHLMTLAPKITNFKRSSIGKCFLQLLSNYAYNTKTASPKAAIAIQLNTLFSQKIFHQFISVNFRRAETVKLLRKLCYVFLAECDVSDHG